VSFKGQKKKMKQPDSIADDLGPKTSKLVSSYLPETMEQFGAVQSIKHSADDIQEPPDLLLR